MLMVWAVQVVSHQSTNSSYVHLLSHVLNHWTCLWDKRASDLRIEELNKELYERWETDQGFFGRAVHAYMLLMMACLFTLAVRTLTQLSDCKSLPYELGVLWSCGNQYLPTSRNCGAICISQSMGLVESNPRSLALGWITLEYIPAMVFGDPCQKWIYNKNLASHTSFTSIPCFPM